MFRHQNAIPLLRIINKINRDQLKYTDLTICYDSYLSSPCGDKFVVVIRNKTRTWSLNCCVETEVNSHLETILEKLREILRSYPCKTIETTDGYTFKIRELLSEDRNPFMLEVLRGNHPCREDLTKNPLLSLLKHTLTLTKDKD